MGDQWEEKFCASVCLPYASCVPDTEFALRTPIEGGRGPQASPALSQCSTQHPGEGLEELNLNGKEKKGPSYVILS